MNWHKNCFMLSFWIQPWLKNTVPWNPETKTYRVSLTLLLITRIVSHLQIKSFVAYWILGDDIRISERINDRFKNEEIWNRDKIGFLLDLSTDICPIRTFVLENRRLPENETVKADSSIPFNTVLLNMNSEKSFLSKTSQFRIYLVFTFYQKQIDYWNIHGQIGVEKHQNRKSVPNDFLGIQYNIRQHNHRHKLLGNALPD